MCVVCQSQVVPRGAGRVGANVNRKSVNEMCGPAFGLTQGEEIKGKKVGVAWPVQGPFTPGATKGRKTVVEMLPCRHVVEVGGWREHITY